MKPRLRPIYLCVIAAGLLLLTGCGQQAPTVTSVDPAVLDSIVAWFVAQLTWSMQPWDMHKRFFVRRRAQQLGGTHAAWVAEANQTTLKNRIRSEYDAVLAYLTAQVGTRGAPGPMITGAGTPPHLDLEDVAKVKTTTSNAAATARAARHRDKRRSRVRAITWRAAAIHDNLWQPSPDDHTATLRQAAMNEVVDRRLRAVERMSFQVSRADTSGLGENPNWNLASYHSWIDGFRVRMFEYPRVPNTAAFRASINSGPNPNNIAPASAQALVNPMTQEWHESTDAAHRRLEYNEPPSGWRFPTAQRPSWDPVPGDPYLVLMHRAGATATAKITALFTPATDWWNRTWAWCDHVIAAIHIEALQFGKRRRNGSDAMFDDILSGNAEGYIQLAPNVATAGGVDANRLMADDVDPYFENIAVDLQDLQIGDQLIFWNSFVYTSLVRGDWRLENALVMDIGNDSTGHVDILQIHLQGHGTSEKSYGPYRQEIVGHLSDAFDEARAAITVAVATNPAMDRLPFNGAADRLVRWSPYESFASPGAWWVRVQFAPWGNADAAVAAIAKAVKDGAAFTNHPLHANDSVFFPLYEPAISGGWATYLAQRLANPAYRAPSHLQRVRADGTLTPGLYHNAPGSPVPTVRPKVTP